MPSNKGLLFFNPTSGAKLSQGELEAAAQEAGFEVVALSPESDVSAMIRDHRARGVNLFVAAGGDGTVNHVLQGVANTEAVLAVIPVGTYNHFARDMEIPLDWQEALKVACGKNVRQVDAARVNHRFFVNNLSLGLYPELVARREERGRDYPRWKARLYAFAATMRKYPHVSLTIESAHHHEAIRTHVFMVSNNSYDLSGIGVEASRQTMEEGRLSVYWLPHMPRIALMKQAGHYLAGKVHHTDGFRSFRTVRMKVQSPRAALRVGIDGELFTMETPLTITSVPKSLSIKVP